MSEEINEQDEQVTAPADCWLLPDLGDEVDHAEPRYWVLDDMVVPAEQMALVGAPGVRLVSRAAWGARPPKRGPSRLAGTLGTKIHYTGGYVSPAIVGADGHRRCAPAVRAIQAGHMDDNNWSDIGYTAVACPHRYVFVGRGPHVLPAANGEGLNSGHYGVLGLVGNRGLTLPPDDLLEGLADAIGWLRATGDAGSEVKGHRDGYSTSCPGAPLYAWVKARAPRGTRLLRLTKPPYMTGRDVTRVQQRLNAHGQRPRLAEDGVFGPLTRKAVVAFQARKRLLTDGIVGPVTRAALALTP